MSKPAFARIISISLILSPLILVTYRQGAEAVRKQDLVCFYPFEPAVAFCPDNTVVIYQLTIEGKTLTKPLKKKRGGLSSLRLRRPLKYIRNLFSMSASLAVGITSTGKKTATALWWSWMWHQDPWAQKTHDDKKYDDKKYDDKRYDGADP